MTKTQAETAICQVCISYQLVLGDYCSKEGVKRVVGAGLHGRFHGAMTDLGAVTQRALAPPTRALSKKGSETQLCTGAPVTSFSERNNQTMLFLMKIRHVCPERPEQL